MCVCCCEFCVVVVCCDCVVSCVCELCVVVVSCCCRVGCALFVVVVLCVVCCALCVVVALCVWFVLVVVVFCVVRCAFVLCVVCCVFCVVRCVCALCCCVVCCVLRVVLCVGRVLVRCGVVCCVVFVRCGLCVCVVVCVLCVVCCELCCIRPLVVQLSSVLGEALQPDSLTEQIQELVQHRAGVLIIVHLLLCALTRFTVQDAHFVLETQLQHNQTQITLIKSHTPSREQQVPQKLLLLKRDYGNQIVYEKL